MIIFHLLYSERALRPCRQATPHKCILAIGVCAGDGRAPRPDSRPLAARRTSSLTTSRTLPQRRLILCRVEEVRRPVIGARRAERSRLKAIAGTQRTRSRAPAPGLNYSVRWDVACGRRALGGRRGRSGTAHRCSWRSEHWCGKERTAQHGGAAAAFLLTARCCVLTGSTGNM